MMWRQQSTSDCFIVLVSKVGTSSFIFIFFVVLIFSAAKEAGRHQPAVSRHVELCYPAVGAGDQRSAVCRSVQHGNWHEGLQSCFLRLIRFTNNEWNGYGSRVQLLYGNKLLFSLLGCPGGSETHHPTRDLSPHLQAHEDMHERRSRQEA